MSKRSEETVFVYEPRKQENIEYFSERNVGLARYLAKLTLRQFGGVVDSHDNMPDNAFWFLNGPISPEEAEALGIEKEDRNFFGGVTDPLYAQKSVFHGPVPNAEATPANFPVEFASHLEKEGVLLPGYTAFSHNDAHRAYDLLVNDGYVPRLKDPIMSASKGQYRLESRKQLDDALKTINETSFSRYGVVLEANMVGKNREELDCLSGGWVEVDGETNTSVGFMTFDDKNITPFNIISSDRFVTRGDDPLPLLGLVDERYHDEVKALAKLREANQLLPQLKATRRNYNFISGYFEKPGGGAYEQKTLRASEPTFRPGGATGAELLAKEYLDTHPEARVVHTKCEIHYGAEQDIEIPPHALIVHKGRYEGPGRYQPHISVATQVFAQVIEAF